ncbi:laminin subunit alpha-3 isoform X1 [Lagenorhynchus albirostris]|uniref:laminin subunit alpha-3 isoform X1 n=1 Tax=Lagenorhynchus albirostris TaxID=27610 RepID=UPI0028EF87BB|nr:laminin subunit alpha-3 isoform X1 [Lagenorhynchus albirostris]XP_059977875.1 laminin subunit alpha-3 isoform X1 [Lagenorhynchus albirostris]XP_059977876.1 laminin subunit alpha-3 isoform X1 [Lagenorhynchus albirostris]XP_059977877.1 laminin subunit alpha-3 isoform X1 [Lagenorhynchus albirostris]XP_059977878.1 laminin subunit alpha-3 isoform X1 [Lagenorhynchus albirostris]
MAAAGRARGWAPRSVLPLLPLLLLLPPPPAGCATARDPAAPAWLSLHPPYFNLAEAARIWATATCGEREPGGTRPRPELYCKLVGGPTVQSSGHTIQGQFCDYCNSEDPRKAHPITNAIDGSELWWQSPPLSSGTQYNKVNVTLDLGQLFQVAYILIKFANSPRPDLWVLERSVDFGSTYSPWQYFAHSKVDCLEQFGQEANRAITRDDDVLCTTDYSRIVPLENGEVVVSLINGRPGAKNFTFSHTLREFTQATNIRLRFLRTNTLLGHLISKAQRDPTVTRRYYYSIKDISIGGRCVCNGHAEVCSANNPEKLFRCECQHHTCGETCDRCCAGYNQRHWRPATREQSNECEACNCHGHAIDCYYDPEVERQQASLNSQGIYAGGGVCIDCQHNTAGVNCEKCAKGYYRPHGVPVHAPDGCIPCSCHPDRAEDCQQGLGRCTCRPNFRGDHCEECAAGYHRFPICSRIPVFPISTPSPEDPVAGDIKGSSSVCDPAGTLDSSLGHCRCKLHVESPTCSICKPLYWNLAKENPSGCSECQCYVAGTVSGIGECGQLDGDCHCKSHVGGDSCDTCEDGYFALEKSSYFGCQGCQCDIGGAVTPVCSGPSGVCRCREHIVGKTCQRPENNYYFPDLHHMRYEIEDGTTPNGRALRFGFEPLEFPEFSWRGYAQMTSIQNEVRIVLNVGKSSLSLFWVVLRYVNPGAEAVSGRVTIYPSWAEADAAQSKETIFQPSKEPAFVTVPGNGSADPFSIVPGTWIACIKVEGVLLDYLVLLPRDYYEALSLQLPVTEPCADVGPPRENCLLYQHLPVTRFPCALASEARHFLLDGQPRPLAVRQPIPEHPVMADLSGREVELRLQLRVPRVGHYVVVVEYATEADQLSEADVHVQGPGADLAGRVNIYSCKYSVLCRSAVTDSRSRLAVYELLEDADVWLKARMARFLLHQICIIPTEEFSVEYLRPHVKCIASYGRFVNESATCISLVPETPPTALILDVPSGGSSPLLPQDPLPSADALTGVTLKAPQNQVTLRGLVPRPGRYVIVVHFYQPVHPTFLVQVSVNRGRLQPGIFRASFCPHVLGCRDQVIAGDQVEFDISEPEVAVTVKVPKGKSLVWVRVLVVPAESYDYQILHRKSVDKSFEFVTNCGGDSFYIDPQKASGFCKDSARSLVALYHDGALPCECHPAGAIGHRCSPEGGQCPCRPHVIGRQCTRCQMGYYGFPHCKPCTCGRRLCEETMGMCLCPPRTVRPQCDACETHSFSFHPLAGCEGCNCSRMGTDGAATPECDRDHGQCRCKPRITGRQCDRCASGFYRFPECLPCQCNRDGTEPAGCDLGTGSCLCKENVEGTECNVCQEGSFYLDPENPKGCTSCFCFGVSHRCHSSHKRRAKFVDMMGWRLETADGVDIPISFNPGSSSVVADLQELPSTVHSASWVAPASYLGDKVSSYGGYLTYQMKSFGLPGDMVLLEKKPDVQLTGQHMSVIYEGPNDPRPDRLHHGRVQVVEGNFRHASSGAPVTREELMMVLSRLQGVHLRGLYFTETQRLTLSGVGLEEASETGSGRQAQNVEMCACPPDYTGDSCQGCSPGYYRDNKGLYTGRCVPCNCNGHSNRCQDGSGICMNCRHNTAGEHCERCKEGYYGNAVHGSCRVCPCPHSNSFATGCVVTGGNVKCSCKAGYTGTQCERCAPGYFGNPQKFGGSCQPCSCNGNGHLGSCDPLTGDCLNQEPKDGGPGEECDDCDSCVMTLLNDLATMEDRLLLVKSQLQGLSASVGTLEQMRHLETQTKDLRSQLLSYSSTVSNHKSKLDGLEKELSNLNREFETLQEKVQINSRKAQTLYSNVDRTTQGAKELDTKIKNVIRNVHVLVKQISGTEGEGNNLPLDDFSRKLAEAESMLRELRNRNFGKNLREAEAEKREAQLLLTRIRSWLENHQVENNGLVKNMRDSLNEYEAKLSDLRAALQEASTQAKQATGLNRENERALESIKRQVKEMNSLQSDFTKHLATADSSLLQTNVALELMSKSHEEYEKLAVTLNEARHELSDKVRELSKSSSKASLVGEAEKHAQSLQELARQLEEIKRNTSGDELVRCAVDAATAYENILNAIKAAEDAADKATSASEAALQTVIKEDVPRKAKTLSSNSDKLLNEAKITQKKLQQEISPALNNLLQTLKIMTVQKGLVDTNLTTIRDDLRGIQRDDIDGIINSAKSMVRNANDITNDVLDGLNPIQTDVERIKDTYGSTGSEDFNKALTDADNSVKKLTSKLPDLLSKIESINQQLLPLGNISDNMDRIRELIQQARDAANKVAIPMRFNGKSGVEVRLPNDLEDLKGYTSLSLFLQRPESTESGGTENMFVMYLGNKDASRDYIGMAVVDGQLTSVYNLGEHEAELQVGQTLTRSETQEAVMDRVKFQRIYQFARLNYTRKATSSKPETPQFHDMESGDSNTLLDLDPENVVFYVGGYPSDFRLPSRLRFPPYQGCIELDDLNENVLSLYNFKKTFNLNTTKVEPCRRRKEESDKNYFEGTGYARVPTQPNAPFPTFGQTIQTTVDRGLLFFAENQDRFISLNIEDGSLMVRYKLNSEQPKEKGIRGIINDGKDHLILIKIGKAQKLMRINVDSQSIKIEGDILDFSTYYLGGIPISIRERFNISTPAFRGCVKNLKKTTGVVRLNDTVGVTKKCSEDWKLVRSASFSRGGQLSFTNLDFPLPSHFQASFGFQTFQPSGILLNHQTGASSLQVTLEDGHIELSTRDSSSPIFTSPQTYMDGLLHYVSIISDNSGLRLLIDDQALKDNQRLLGFSNSQQSLRLGGSYFEGCISNVFIQRLSESPEVLDLASKSTKRDVSLGGCSLNESPFLMLLNGSMRFNKDKTFNIHQPWCDTPAASPRSLKVRGDAQSCPPLPEAQASHGALRFGDSPTSHLLFMLPQEMLKPRSQFAVDLQTTASRGLVFYTGTKNSFMALYLSKGRLVFALGAGGKQLKLKSKEKCSDGKWHTVAFGQDGERGRLVVDGLRAREGSLPGNSTISLRAPVYLGSSPSGKPKTLPQNSFVGCLRNFQLDLKPLDTASASFGVSPCLDGSLEKGIYFSQEGGHVILANSVLLGPEFKLVFSIRPRSLTGILIHVGSQPGEHLSVYMEAGKVTASVGSEAGGILTSVTPKQSLCDGQWHSVTVTIKQHILHLKLDADHSSTAGRHPVPTARTQEHLHIGGVPANLKTLKLPVWRSFFGCLKNIQVNHIPVPVTEAAEVRGTVSLNGCPDH